MKNTQADRPNMLKVLLGVGAFTAALCLAEPAVQVGKSLLAKTQPARAYVSNLVLDLTSSKPDPLYVETTDQVAVLKSMLRIGDLANKQYAQELARKFYDANITESLRLNLAKSPLPRDAAYSSAIDFIRTTAGIK